MPVELGQKEGDPCVISITSRADLREALNALSIMVDEGLPGDDEAANAVGQAQGLLREAMLDEDGEEAARDQPIFPHGYGYIVDTTEEAEDDADAAH